MHINSQIFYLHVLPLANSTYLRTLSLIKTFDAHKTNPCYRFTLSISNLDKVFISGAFFYYDNEVKYSAAGNY